MPILPVGQTTPASFRRLSTNRPRQHPYSHKARLALSVPGHCPDMPCGDLNSNPSTLRRLLSGLLSIPALPG